MGTQTLGDDSRCTGPLCAALTSVQPKEAFVAEHLLKAVKAVFIHELSHERARGALVLHSSLYQVDGIHGSGSDS